MATYKYYSENLRVRLGNDSIIKTIIRAKFQKRVFLFIWKTITSVDFNVYNYWDPFQLHKKYGWEYKPMRDTYKYGGKIETWKPEYFNLDKSLQEHWLTIIDREGQEEHVSNLINT